MFIHYSGFKHKDNILSIHQNRFDFDNCGDVVSELFKLYSSELFANDADDVSNIEYGYGKYADGSSLPNFLRETYLSLEDSPSRTTCFCFRRAIKLVGRADEYAPLNQVMALKLHL